MRIATHQSKDAPPEHAWIAAFYVPFGKAGKEERLPMVFFGSTKDIAVARADAWILDERAKEAAREVATAERVASAKARRPASGGSA